MAPANLLRASPKVYAALKPTTPARRAAEPPRRRHTQSRPRSQACGAQRSKRRRAHPTGRVNSTARACTLFSLSQPCVGCAGTQRHDITRARGDGYRQREECWADASPGGARVCAWLTSADGHLFGWLIVSDVGLLRVLANLVRGCREQRGRWGGYIEVPKGGCWECVYLDLHLPPCYLPPSPSRTRTRT